MHTHKAVSVIRVNLHVFREKPMQRQFFDNRRLFEFSKTGQKKKNGARKHCRAAKCTSPQVWAATRILKFKFQSFQISVRTAGGFDIRPVRRTETDHGHNFFVHGRRNGARSSFFVNNDAVEFPRYRGTTHRHHVRPGN